MTSIQQESAGHQDPIAASKQDTIADPPDMSGITSATTSQSSGSKHVDILPKPSSAGGTPSALTPAPHMSFASPSATGGSGSASPVVARRVKSEVIPAPVSALGGRPPNPIPTQQRMLQSTFSVSSIGSQKQQMQVYARPASKNNSMAGSMVSQSQSQSQSQPEDQVTTGIYTATYSGIQVVEMMVNGVAVMRRRHDSSLNATQILKVAGVDKSKRTKILEREILTGKHEKVQGGYGKYQGTWIPYDRGVSLCKQYSVFDILQPLLEFNPSSGGMDNTPTKEQAMAARRKCITQYHPLNLAPPSTSSVLTFTNPLQVSGGFNTPLSHLASEALTKLGKATRSDTYPQVFDAFHQQAQENMVGSITDSPEGPVRKKFKSETDQSLQQQSLISSDDGFEIDESLIPTSSIPHKPLDLESTSNFENSKLLITQVFVGTENSNLVEIMGGEERVKSVDLDVPIDDLQHTALHWASVLARISLVRDLIKHGADVLRGNYAGESGLIRAVLVTNNSDVSSFPQLLDLLYPAIPLVDTYGRSVLHHIALTAGIKGRSEASKYYLSCLLEWIVKRGSKNKNSRLSLGTFIRDVVNARDKNGDTALNIAARVGNKNIAQQLLEVGADETIPNRAGLRPIDFGIRLSPKADLSKQTATAVAAAAVAASDETRSGNGSDGTVSATNTLTTSGDMSITAHTPPDRKEILSAITSVITEVDEIFEKQYNETNEALNKTHQDLRQANTQLEANKLKLEKLKSFSDSIVRDERRAKNLERAIEECESKENSSELQNGSSHDDADAPYAIQSVNKVYAELYTEPATELTTSLVNNALAVELRTNPTKFKDDLPPKQILLARINAYRRNEENLKSMAQQLRGRSAELERKYRRIVAQCAAIEEENVDDLLEGLVQAVESDPGEVDLSRVAGFLRKVDDGVNF